MQRPYNTYNRYTMSVASSHFQEIFDAALHIKSRPRKTSPHTRLLPNCDHAILLVLLVLFLKTKFGNLTNLAVEMRD